MTQEYCIWKPERDGHAPPNWREGMKWGVIFYTHVTPGWSRVWEYTVPAEALNSPNDDARQEALKELTRLGQEADALEAISLVRKLPADFLAKHGIALAPEKDWATELWADLLEKAVGNHEAEDVRVGQMTEEDAIAIDLIRTRFEQMKGEGR